MKHVHLKILFLCSEAVPFAKTGGLGDVGGSLPLRLAKLGQDVRLVLPLYRVTKEQGLSLVLLAENIGVPLGYEELPANILKIKSKSDFPVYFVQREDLYERPNLYANEQGDYYDNLERFTFYSHAALLSAQFVGFKPDIIHCHDWQSGLVPALVRGPYAKNPTFGTVSLVFTIHNIGYQGIFPKEKLYITGLSEKEFFHPEGLEYWDKISLLKSGIVYSDAVTTVSPRYAREIQSPEYGMGMEGILRKRKERVYGILNGVDYDSWDPSKDRYLPATYCAEDLAGKGRCKEALVLELGLLRSMVERPLLGVVSRLDAQKGLDLILKVIEPILEQNVGLVILGSGSKQIKDKITEVMPRHAGRMAFKYAFDEPLAHRIIAGVDMLLVPSRYEPCGLTQMYALKYGTVPVVHATGGLDDTVVEFDPSKVEGNGFKFSPFDHGAFLDAIKKALHFFSNRELWRAIMLNGMQADFSWARSAKQYLDLYRSVVDRFPGRKIQ